VVAVLPRETATEDEVGLAMSGIAPGDAAPGGSDAR